MRRKKLKGFVIPLFGGVIASIVLISIISFEKIVNTAPTINGDYTYVNDSIIDKSKPVMSEEDVVIRPYVSENIEIYKKFYDESNNNDSSIIFLNGTYIQNSGIIYNSVDEFNVVSILDGEVIDTKKNDIFNYVVEVKHSNGLVSSYEGLKSINVKKGDQIKQNELIGKSGEISLDVNLKNALIFELIKDGKYVNPEVYFDKSIKEL